MYRTIGRFLLVAAAFLLFLVPVAAIGNGGFEDVPEGHIFENDIDWLSANNVTRGCNPPTNTRFCPDDNVTRGQMAAFMHRLAGGVVDAATLDGLEAAAFAPADHEHRGDLVTAASGSNWRVHGGGASPIAGSFGAYVFLTSTGDIELGIDAPVMIGSVAYQLDNVEVCYEMVGSGTYVDLTAVMTADIGMNQHFIASDNTDYLASGCHTLNVGEATPNGAAVRLKISDSDGGGTAINVYGVTATWEAIP